MGLNRMGAGQFPLWNSRSWHVLVALVALLPQAHAQICNSRDPHSGGMFLPAFSYGTAMASICHGERESCKEECTGNLTQLSFCERDKYGEVKEGCCPAPYDPQGGYAALYFLLLVWTFIGVSVIAHIFMHCIDVIAGATAIVTIKDKTTGGLKQVQTMVWNFTVCNLTLMAVGTCAPEILLSSIEIVSDHFFFRRAWTKQHRGQCRVQPYGRYRHMHHFHPCYKH